MKEPKIILFDLETLPIMDEVMKVMKGIGAYPGLTMKASINSVLCFGYKEFGKHNKTIVKNAWDYKASWKKSVNNDKELVALAYETLKDADLIVTHNGKRFDEKFLNTRLLLHGLKPLPKIAHVDTCQLAKRAFFFNNRLGTLGELLVGQAKVETGGWDLWVKCSKRDPKAMKQMAKYCAGDVDLLEKIFIKLRPFATNIPNYNLFALSKKNICPSCSSTRLRALGWRYTKTSSYRRYICIDCGTASSTNAKDEMPRAV